MHAAAHSLADVFPPYGKSTAWKKRQLKHLKRLKRFQPDMVQLDSRIFHYPDAVSFAFAWEQIFLNECYRFESACKAPRIIDCGANIGLASIYWKTRIPGARITAVEADPMIFSYMAKNFLAAGIDDIECLNEAIWHESGELEFTSHGADGGAVTSPADSALGGTIRVKARPLPELLADEPVDLLKIDVEGAECQLLIGRQDWLTDVRRVFVEYHSYPDREQRLDEILASLRSAGFRIHLQPELVSTLPFVDLRIDEGMDQRINIYAYRS